MNNSLYDNDTQKTGSGEFQIQYRATGIVFENNIVDAGAQGLFIHGYVAGSGVTANYNDYYTTSTTTTFELNDKSLRLFRGLPGSDWAGLELGVRQSRLPHPATCTSTKESWPPTPVTDLFADPEF